ncbi:MAG: hypothetical protein NVSMB14_12140 [Isosphaeraceae bacterium]
MPAKILDTNVLILHWKRSREIDLKHCREDDAKQWARRLIKLEGTNRIVMPVFLEFICGVRTKHELKLTQAYLGEFTLADAGRVLPEDWKNAKQIAQRIPRDGRPRGLADCLIKAIAGRLGMEVRTFDTGMP